MGQTLDTLDADDGNHILSDDKLEELRIFLGHIRSCEDEEEKYDTCLRKRDHLLETQNTLEIEFAFYEAAFSESITYRASRRSLEWKEFSDVAAKGLRSRQRTQRELEKAGRFWGEDLIHHYGFSRRGVAFARQLAATAGQHPSWQNDALPRFQQLVCRRIRLSEHGRHRYLYPLERTDLVNAKAWTKREPYVKDKDPEHVSLDFVRLKREQLPDGYGFDKYGLIVPFSTADYESESGSTEFADLDSLDVSSRGAESLRRSLREKRVKESSLPEERGQTDTARKKSKGATAASKRKLDLERLKELNKQLQTSSKRPRTTSTPYSEIVARDASLSDQSDEVYLSQAISELELRALREPNSRGAENARLLLPILQSCTRPNMDDATGVVDLLALSGCQAKELLDSHTPCVPIITSGQQRFKWEGRARPIVEFFDWIEDHDRMVSVQIPSLETTRSSFEHRSIRQIRERFLSSQIPDDPWNILDCACPVPSTLPDFLMCRNCQLLTRVRDSVLSGNSAERVTASTNAWTYWRDIESWAIFSEGGHCTAPHTDGHGLSTWITLQEGLLGFLWMSRPTDRQWDKWMKDPSHYDDGQQWRFLILRPGQTIFFGSGMIHGVFRIKQWQTLGLGGHLLQWTGIDQWMNVVDKQIEAPASTNEDATDIRKWISVVQHLVQRRLERSTLKS